MPWSPSAKTHNFAFEADAARQRAVFCRGGAPRGVDQDKHLHYQMAGQ